MTGDPILAWSETLNKRIVIGVSAWDGREGFSSPALTQREKPWAKEGFATGDLPSYQEAQRPRVHRGLCACGRSKARKRGTCQVCYQVGRRLKRKAA